MAVAGLQVLPIGSLAVAAILALLLAAFVARARWRKLMWRSRWVFAALILIFSFGTPGLLAFPSLGVLGPSVDGLVAAVEHGLRLAAIVSLVAVLLEHSAPAILVSGLYSLARPLSWAGLDASRAAVRLMLVLEFVDQPPRAGWREWLGESVGSSDLPSRYGLPRQGLGWQDAIAVATFAALLMGLAAAVQ